MRLAPDRPRRIVVLLGLALVTLALTACQVKVDVQADVHADGSGTVTVGLGLDDEALAKIGDLDTQLRVDDLRAAGWAIDGPARQADGYTWVRATKGFADAAAASEVMDEVNGADGAFRQWQVTRSTSLLSTSYRVSGTIDLTKGMQTFGDAQLSQLFGGDPFAAGVKKLEQEQGRPVAEMVDVRVTVDTPGGSRTYTPSLADQEPVAVAVSSSTTNWAGVAGLALVVAGAAVVVAVVLLRRRAVRLRREPGAGRSARR